MSMSISQQLLHTTIRILTDTGSGTGFFFNFQFNQKTVPVIVTNKHVVKNSKIGTLCFSEKGDNNLPLFEKQKVKITIDNFEQSWISHPDPNIDLCVHLVGPITNFSTNLLAIMLNEQLIPDNNTILSFESIEQITMIGYPNGIWDEKNNIPIVRQGITATPIKLNYNGKDEFLIDCACFPGSSGSPVFIYNSGNFNNVLKSDATIHFIGILYAGPQHTATGDIIFQPIQNMPKAIINIPNNLGCVIKSNKLLDFKPILEKLIPELNTL